MEKIFLKPNEDRRIRLGHLWIFSNEISNASENIVNGDLVEVYDAQKKFLGTGFYNKNSLIAVRIISFEKLNNLKSLFKNRLLRALEYRNKIYPSRNSFRLVFGESDFLPGLIIDKYNDTYILQVNSFGIYKNIEMIVEILLDDLKAKNIFTKNDLHLRKIEGLPETDEIYFGKPNVEIISDGSLKFQVDFANTQKTGFYFDQNDNRFFIEKLVNGLRTADIFCNSGGFGLHALKAGAKSVDFVDSSKIEIKNVKENLLLNNMENDARFFEADAFNFLEESATQGKVYDVVMIDPPAFAKNKKTIPTAIKGYEKLNKLAIQILDNSGYLISSSCSYHVNRENFLDAVNKAAIKCSKRLQLIYFAGASLDHPQLPMMPETSYLKFAVFRIFNR